MEAPPITRERLLMGAVDARDIVPVEDIHGGVTIYHRGRPTRYLLAGEWYQARPELGPLGATSPVEPAADWLELRD